MPQRLIPEEIKYLRSKAERLRKLATDHHTPLSKDLAEIASEFDRHADDLERRHQALIG